jgi:hypothetical protein
MDSNRERDDRTPRAEFAYKNPLSDHAPARLASSRLYSITSFVPVCSVRLRGLDGGALGTLGRTGLESVAELAVDGLEVSHAAGTGGLPSLGLLAPVDCPVLIDGRGARTGGVHTLAGLSSRVAALGAGVLLDVERPLT